MPERLVRWWESFDERALAEIRFARLYSREFAHGTPGHQSYMIIAALTQKLDDMQAEMWSALFTRKELIEMLGEETYKTIFEKGEASIPR